MDYPKKDKWHRPVMPHPQTGKEQSWTRVTTVAGTLDKTWNLSQRDQRLVAYGLSRNDDLQALAMSAQNPDDKGVLNDVIAQAKSRAAADAKANIGTALHGFTQRIDSGERNVKVPTVYQPLVEQYRQKLIDEAVQIMPDMIEVIVCLPDLGLVGTIDRIVIWRNMMVVFDLKTGNLDFAKVKIAQQLAAYANATHRWDGMFWHPLRDLNKQTGLVLHLPAGDEKAEPEIHKVDLVKGYQYLLRSQAVREIQNGMGKDLFEAVPRDAAACKDERPAVGRIDVLKARVRSIIDAGHYDQLAGRWPVNMPTLAEGGLTDAQLTQVERWCTEIEQEHQ